MDCTNWVHFNVVEEHGEIKRGGEATDFVRVFLDEAIQRGHDARETWRWMEGICVHVRMDGDDGLLGGQE